MTPARSIVLAAGMLALVAALACYTLDEPAGGVESISGIIAPYPAVVVGDQSRDTNGAVAPFRVVAFDQAGDTIHGLQATFVALQRGLTFDASGVATGDSVVQRGVEIVGSVGGLQTLPIRVPVTVAPQRARKEGEAQLDFVVSTDPADTVNTANRRELRLILSGDASVPGVPADTFAVGFIVEFRIIEAPDPGTPGQETAVLVSTSTPTQRGNRDTTDQSGVATQSLQLRPVYFGTPDVISGTRPDTVKVEAIVRYPSVPATASPVVFTIPVMRKSAPSP